ncbi:MAG: VWA domain-containing protein [Polyangiaceae bacterium]
MRFRRFASLCLGFAVVGVTSLVGCGGSSDSATNDGDLTTGGSAGSAGSSGASGTAGSAGSSGSSGSSGTAGTGGTSGCAINETLCGTTCSDTKTDPKHCGTCDTNCPVGSNGEVGCVDGMCTLSCNDGFKTCTGSGACEINTKNDPNNCGDCGVVCPLGLNGAPACIDGVCGFDCDAGYADCRSDDPGCETYTNQDSINCGSCGTTCAGDVNAYPDCNSGHCGIQCLPGFTDCYAGIPGCETHTSQDVLHCGTCDLICPPGDGGDSICFNGQCAFACQPGLGDCNFLLSDGCETNIENDSTNCGYCGNVCPDGGTCVGGACQCAGATQEAQKIPLDVFIMLDRSGSMQGARWSNVTQALKDFVNSPGSNGVGVWLEYFEPLSGDACNANDYAVPQVPYGVLPGAATAIVSSLNSTSPDGLTPTTPALHGAEIAAVAHKNGHPDHKVIVLLATDGVPTSCSSSVDATAQVAANALAGNPSVITYVIGIGNVSGLNQIAAAGGSSSAFIVDGGNSSAFLAAMQSIQQQTLGCEYLVPTLPPGQSIDPSKVNVLLTPSGGSAVVLNSVGDASGCNQDGGWYFDNVNAPTKIYLCPSTCSIVSADQGAKIEVQVGCPAKIPD